MGLFDRLSGRKGRKKRVVVIGIDGVPYTYVRRLFAAGELPNFRALAGEGALAQMDTTLPNVSSDSGGGGGITRRGRFLTDVMRAPEPNGRG